MAPKRGTKRKRSKAQLEADEKAQEMADAAAAMKLAAVQHRKDQLALARSLLPGRTTVFNPVGDGSCWLYAMLIAAVQTDGGVPQADRCLISAGKAVNLDGDLYENSLHSVPTTKRADHNADAALRNAMIERVFEWGIYGGSTSQSRLDWLGKQFEAQTLSPTFDPSRGLTSKDTIAFLVKLCQVCNASSYSPYRYSPLLHVSYIFQAASSTGLGSWQGIAALTLAALTLGYKVHTTHPFTVCITHPFTPHVHSLRTVGHPG